MATETLRTAWIGLLSHRLRTALTVLGITIGIASVIVLIAVGKGSSDAVRESIDALGSKALTVTAPGRDRRAGRGGLRGDAGSRRRRSAGRRRTRPGDRRSDILGQFLTEALLVSAIGGLLGIAAGLVGSQFRIAGVQPAVASYSVVPAAAASLGSGLFFGTYPAMRAARLRPIEALRFE